jgi:hypothetical protein
LKDEPNKITTTLKVVITGEFYDDEASEETLRYCVEQDLENAGFDVDVELLKEQEPIHMKISEDYGFIKFGECPKCKAFINNRYFPESCGCGQAVKWE